MYREDITDLILGYQSAIKSLWCNHARGLDTTRFGVVEEAYFNYSVLSQADRPITEFPHPQHHYYNCIHVSVSNQNSPVEAYILREDGRIQSYDKAEGADLASSELRFMYLDEIPNSLEKTAPYQYAVAYVVESKNSSLIGSTVFVNYESCIFTNTRA